MGDIFIRTLSMPHRVYGATVVDADGNYNIYVNESLCDKKQKETVQHEMQHIHKGHFYDAEPVEQNERDAAF